MESTEHGTHFRCVALATRREWAIHHCNSPHLAQHSVNIIVDRGHSWCRQYSSVYMHIMIVKLYNDLSYQNKLMFL